MGMNKIPIVFATDQNYLWPTSVAIISLFKNANPNTFYDIYILLGSKLSNEDESLIKNLECSNGKITLVIVGDIFDNSYIGESYVSTSTYYRLLITEILADYSKCIYLDSDIIVLQDLSDLFNINMEEYYLAGVKDLKASLLAERFINTLNLSTVDYYINGGVLVMNLNKIRLDGVDKQFLALASNEYLHHDQDIVNIACADKIKLLPFKYNWITKYFISGYDNRIKSHYIYITEGSISEEILESPIIVHYALKMKPWKYNNCYLGDLWWDYAKFSPFTNVYRSALADNPIDCEMDDLINLLNNNMYDGYYIFSAGTMGDITYRILREYASSANMLGFVDNRTELHGQLLFGHLVIPYEQCRLGDNILFVLSPHATNAQMLLAEHNRKYVIVQI
ncbi:MAG: hypothetical protein BEN18_00430 [Epulopiscium sp. Nuni2H_MBin001]|nr:MAG: hypothetical protein BEN18_00430 [Epulopiscium sp. Nuni2H_MBin001]